MHQDAGLKTAQSDIESFSFFASGGRFEFGRLSRLASVHQAKDERALLLARSAIYVLIDSA